MSQSTQVQEVRLEVDLSVPQSRVFEALTGNAPLAEWFCEHADVSPEENRYDFWGCFTPEGETRAEGRHPLLSFQPDVGLAYEWHVRGGTTRVEYSVAANGEGTTLAVAHLGLRPRGREEASLTDWWGHCLENLKSWLERDSIAPRRDFTMRPGRPFRISVEIDAPREKVFRALTDPRELERYVAEPGGAVVETRVGGRYEFGWGENDGPQRIVALEPNAKLSYSWRFETEPETVVTWTLEAAGKKTRLILTHEGFPDWTLFDAYVTGWRKFLNRVKHMVEGGAGWKRAVAASADY